MARTPLHVAAASGQGDAASLLLSRGASTAVRDLNGFSPLHLAANAGESELAAMLLRSGAHADARNYKGQTPLHFATARGATPLVKLLLDSGAHPGVQDGVGASPLQIAAAHGDPEVVALLQQRLATAPPLPAENMAQSGVMVQPTREPLVASGTSQDYYEQVAERYADKGGGGTRNELRQPGLLSRPLGQLVLQKLGGAILGGLLGAIAGGSVGLVGTLLHTGRLAGAGPQVKQAAAFMGTVFAAGGAFQG